MNENKVTDPSKDEMVSYLKDFFGEDREMIDIEAAIYWFAKDYHEGQNSKLYSASSTSRYKPSSSYNNVKFEDESIIHMYDELVDKFSGERTHKTDFDRIVRELESFVKDEIDVNELTNHMINVYGNPTLAINSIYNFSDEELEILAFDFNVDELILNRKITLAKKALREKI